MQYERRTQPTATTNWDDAHSFRVWVYSPTYLEDRKPWKLSASFRYLVEALEYIAAQQDDGNDTVFQSPSECRLVRHDERRVVYPVEMANGIHEAV